MTLSLQQKIRYQEGNRQEYGERYGQLYFPDGRILAEAAELRRSMLLELAEKSVVGCLGTKIDMANLSPGCRTCVAGQWSCLFINGKCNGNCFYCPTRQNEVGQPTTNSICFPEARDYVAYLERFGFEGASISGGEPLLTLDKSVRFVRSIKKHFGDTMHVWLYTNGILATVENIRRLADAGLNEIRFDIGATNYNYRQLEHAVGVIPTVTVEIPAVPEDGERLKDLLPSLYDTGVQYLNLHQLRLTPYNYDKLVVRGYRFLHGEKVTVLDSELTALDILCHAKRNNIELPINYCSFPYKNRFQSLAARRRNGSFIQKSHEELTENGFIRTLTLAGDTEILARLCSSLTQDGCDSALWQLSSPDKLHIHPLLLSHVDFRNLGMQVRYSAAYQRPCTGYRNPFTNVAIGKKMKIVIERETHPHHFDLSPDQAHHFAHMLLPAETEQMPGTAGLVGLPEEMLSLEYVREGLADYF